MLRCFLTAPVSALLAGGSAGSGTLSTSDIVSSSRVHLAVDVLRLYYFRRSCQEMCCVKSLEMCCGEVL